MFDRLPDELKAFAQWVVWRSEPTADGRWTKVPYNARTGAKASVTSPSDWATFDIATHAAPYYSGVGFVLSRDDPFTFIDLDAPQSPEQAQRHGKLFSSIESYAELSPSGQGVHFIVKGSVPKGLRRDKVEVYSAERYMTCTGNVLKALPVTDAQPLLDILYREMNGETYHGAPVEGWASIMSDQQVLDMAASAANAEKFLRLAAGHWVGDYPSQSEADFALLSIFAFYTQDAAQVKRLFRMTELGKRDKATKDDRYLNLCLGRILSKYAPPLDFSQLAARAQIVAMGQYTPATPETPVASPLSGVAPVFEARELERDFSLPPGLVGEMAYYIYNSAIRPVKEIALAGALGIMAGIAGRAFNISRSGLNQYIVAVAPTGTGKDEISAGTTRLINAARTKVPMITDFVGPAVFASGQAIIKVLDKRPCFFSVIGEFGMTLRAMTTQDAQPHMMVYRQVLLDVYGKSGHGKVLNSMAYADAEKNTKIIVSPNVTIIGETTPEALFSHLDQDQIGEGLLPRFSFISYRGARPPMNENHGAPPPEWLATKLAELAAYSLTLAHNNAVVNVELDPDAKAVLDAYGREADRHINERRSEVIVQLWNRAHLKALKIAGLLAVGVNPATPVVNLDMATWAMDFVNADLELITRKFEVGDVGSGDLAQMITIRRYIKEYLTQDWSTVSKISRYRSLHEARIIPVQYLQARCVNRIEFKKAGGGSGTEALKKALANMAEFGELVLVPKAQLARDFGCSVLAYGLGSHWLG